MSIVEIAKAAGVSTATVSRVLNDLPGVRFETAQLVRETLEEFKFQRKRRRRGELQGPLRVSLRTGNIAVIAVGHSRTWLQMPVMASVVYGIQRACSEFGYRLILDDIPDPGKPSSLVESRQIEGAVVFLSSMLSEQQCREALAGMSRHIPIVCAMGLETTDVAVDRVTSDGLCVGALAHFYLQGRGCKNIGFLTADEDFLFVRVRANSFLDSAFRAGHCASLWVVGETGRLAQMYGRNVVAASDLELLVGKLARHEPRIDGLFVANDVTTVRIYPLLAREGIEIGKHLTILSCDNEEARLSALQPRPQSIDLNGNEIGYRAVVRLISRLKNPGEVPLSIQIPPRILPIEENVAPK